MVTSLITKPRFIEILGQLRGKRIAIVGDVMLDRYLWGNVTRISPEAPVPVCVVDNESMNLGGAANVAQNIKGLGAEPILFGVRGNDESAALMESVLHRENLQTSGIVVEATRPTTTKLRVIAADHHLVRVDRESTAPINPDTQARLLAEFKAQLSSFDGVILQDYNKGVLNPSVIDEVVKLSRERGIPVTVDPKFDNFFSYQNVTVFKPNRNELERVLDSRLTPETEEQLVRKVMDRLHCTQLLLTLGKRGMVLYDRQNPPVRQPAYVLELHDVSGAGDTVIAAYTLALIAKASAEEAMFVANLSAAVVCSKIGAQPVFQDELLAAFDTLIESPAS